MIRAAEWTHTDEERSIEYETCLHYEVDEGEIEIGDVDLLSVIDWFYNPKMGVEVKYGDEREVIDWLLKQIRECEATRESAEAACRADLEECVELLREQSLGII